MTDVPSGELLARFRRHDADAAEALFRRYADRLTRLARARLSRKLRARLDPEDVVLSAYRSFFRLARVGEVTLGDAGDLWRLLVCITLRKVCRSARRHRAVCRSVERERAWPDGAAGAFDAGLLAPEPTPADAAALLDELRHLLAPLDPAQRRIVEMRLQGHGVEAIAAAVGRSARTVRRALAGLEEELRRRLEVDPPPAEVPAVATSLRYADYVLQRQLGEGGMGKVYRALRRPDGAAVAVKILRKPLRGHGAAAARFLREAELLARLRHPGVVAFHGLGRLPDGGHFLVMDLVEGRDLGRPGAGPVSAALALRWVREAAEAIAHAHEQGVVHCDLKPGNLLLDRAGRVHVSDFGLARSMAAGGEATAGGTAGFMAPEQFDAALGPASPRTDVFGLGAVLYALLAGRPPCVADGPGGPALAAVRPDLPAGVASLCRRCLAREPHDRPSSAADLAEALRALEGGG